MFVSTVSIRPETVFPVAMAYDHIFNKMEIVTDPFALCEIHGRCSISLNRQGFATLHYILAGEGEILLDGEPNIPVRAGSLVLIPSNMRHTLHSFGEVQTMLQECHPAELDLVNHLKKAPDETDGKLLAICTKVKVGLQRVSNLIDLIRQPLVLETDGTDFHRSSLNQLLRELARPRLGSKAMVRALLLANVIDLMRERIKTGDPSFQWMVLLKDERLWTALRAMLDTPGDQHSLESLADMAGMSRSNFAQRFSEACGSGPMEFLRDVRMHLAGSMLIQSDLPVKRVAELVGFKSRSAFTRAFELKHGCPPTEFRRDEA